MLGRRHRVVYRRLLLGGSCVLSTLLLVFSWWALHLPIFYLGQA